MLPQKGSSLRLIAHKIIERSKKLNSDSSRKLFLHNNSYNRKVIEEWEKVDE